MRWPPTGSRSTCTTSTQTVAPRPTALLAFEVTLEDLATALERNNVNVGAGYIERFGSQYLVRVPGRVASLDEIRAIRIATHDGTPIVVGDVAEVTIGKDLRTGAATMNGEEVVLGTVFMLMGENSRIVARAAADKLAEVNASLPAGLRLEAVYDRTTLVDKTIATVRTNLFEALCSSSPCCSRCSAICAPPSSPRS